MAGNINVVQCQGGVLYIVITYLGEVFSRSKDVGTSVRYSACRSNNSSMILFFCIYTTVYLDKQIFAIFVYRNKHIEWQ
jgi:hypothetical protein